jgi:hypothetical protein
VIGVPGKFLKTGLNLFAVSSAVFGTSHFLVAPYIATLIPAWIPERLFWAWFTGAPSIGTRTLASREY